MEENRLFAVVPTLDFANRKSMLRGLKGPVDPRTLIMYLFISHLWGAAKNSKSLMALLPHGDVNMLLKIGKNREQDPPPAQPLSGSGWLSLRIPL